MLTDFSTEYSGKTDAELLQLACERDELLEEAAIALDAELRRRGLTDSDRIEHHQFIKQQQQREQRIQRRRKFVDRRSLLNQLVALAFGGSIYLGYRAIPSQYQLNPGWEQSAASVLAASTFIVYMMGTWNKVEFWVTLDISSVIHLLILRALAPKFPIFEGFSPAAIGLGIAIFFMVYLGIWVWQRGSREREATGPG